MTDQTVEGQAVEVSTELVAHEPPAPTSLFRTDDPVEVVEKATRIADALKDVIVQKGLFTVIRGKAHIQVEGWQLLGSMLGVTAVCVGTEPVDAGYKATVEARAVDGRVVGRADAMCTRHEKPPAPWSKADDYALLSMAQTRATSKALKGPLGFVVSLAGYATTPAEEMTFAEPDGPEGRTSQTDPPTQAQLTYLKRLVTTHKPPMRTLTAMLEAVGAHGVDPSQEEWSKALKRDQVSRLIGVFKSGTLPTGESDIPNDLDPAARGQARR